MDIIINMDIKNVSDNNFTVIDYFQALCKQNPNKISFAFLNEKGDLQLQLTRAELHQAALNLANYLVNTLKIVPGSCVLLVYPQSLDFVIALLACLYAGIIPAPISPPNPFRDIKYELETFRRIAKNCQCAAILTNGTYSNIKKLTSLRHLFSLGDKDWSDLLWHRTDKFDATVTTDFIIKPAKLTDIAYYQFTSGSTTDPKGVVITYSNLAHQLEVMSERLNFTENNRGVIWVPQYHSTCLVSVIFNTLQNGGLTYFFSPLAFLKQPTLWFETITRYQATHTTAPEFAIKKMLEYSSANGSDKFDLSSLKMLCVGGETNNYDTMIAFTKAFAGMGFNPMAYTPGYGMTEHTLGIAMTAYDEQPYAIGIDKQILLNENKFTVVEPSHKNITNCVSNGRPLAGVEIKIVNLESKRECEAGEIGEILVSSMSVANKYSGAQDPLSQTHIANLNNLHTGDLGTIFNGHLFVTGRLKDMIVINGRNIYLNDIDHLLNDCHPSVLSHQIAALSVDNKLVVLLETNKNANYVKKEAPIIFANIRSILTKSLSIVYEVVHVCQDETILRTNSGKIRRHPTRDAFIQKKLAHKIIVSSDVFAS